MIRKYNAEDLAELLDVWYDASQIGHPFLSRDFLDQERRTVIQEYLPNAETWVFEEEGQVVGFIALIGNEVGGIFVTPRRHGQGIGRALMDHARASRNHLDVEVFEANEIGRAFYHAYGFKVIRPVVHEETGEPVLRLRLDC
ncbi:MAG: GNAT family N-acetyltransferase [Acidimicrobiia bacterium]